MSAINLHTTKSAALYFRDSQINKFYEFGGIQLLPNNSYTQKTTIDLDDLYTISILKVADDSVMGSLSYSITEVINVTPSYYWSITPTVDCSNNLIYLKFTYGLINYYTNPFYITSLSEDNVTNFTYKDLASNQYETIGLKTWFRQKSKQTELTTYYESSTGRTVTQAIKTKSLEMYESEFMSTEDLIMTAKILENPYLYIGSTRYYLFESVKIPELTQQENFGKIKFIINPIENPSIITNGLVLNLDAGNTLSYPGTGTLWTDLSGNGNNGTLVNSPSFDSANGGSIVFDGTNQYVNCGNASNLQITVGTISAWVKTTTPGSSYRGIIVKGFAWGLFVKDGILITYDWGMPANMGTRTTGINISDGTWKNVVMTFTETIGTPSNNVIIYLNGNPVLTTTVKHSSNSNNVQLGSNTTGINQFLNGNISQALIYNRALSSTEVIQNFNETKGRYGL